MFEMCYEGIYGSIVVTLTSEIKFQAERAEYNYEGDTLHAIVTNFELSACC